MFKICYLSQFLYGGGGANHKLLSFLLIQPRFLSVTTSIVPTHQQISHLILEQKSSNEALQAFEWASKIPSFTHTPSTYRALIHKLSTFRQFKLVEQLLDEMPSSIGSFPDDDIFITIVRGFGRARMPREVIGVLNLVSKFGKGAPSLKLMNSILDFLVKEDIDIAREFYRKKIVGSGMKGDDYTYGILMKGFCLTNRIGDGFKLLQLMKTHGVKVNPVVYNTLIYALCKNHKVGRARSLMNEMEDFSDVTFNTLISAYCSENNLVQALVMMEKCFNNGFVPDIVALTKVIETLCNEERFSEAVDLLDRFEEKEGTIDVVAYNILIKGFVRAGKVRVGRGFIKQMEMKGCLPNTDTYNVLIMGCCESGMLDLDLALDMFYEMKRVGVNWNIITFETLTYGLCSQGRTHDAFKIFALMSGCKESFYHIGPYNNIIYGLYKENRLDEALEFLNEMRIFFPRAVDRSLRILQLSQEGSIEGAKNVLETTREQGIVLNALVYVSLIQGFCGHAYMKEAVELMNEMIGHGYYPNSSTFNCYISGFCGQGKMGTALRLVDDLKMRGGVPDCESYGFIINGFCSQGDTEDAFILFMQMLKSGLTPDYYIWNALIVVMLKGTYMFQDHKLFQSLIRT